MPSPYNTDTNQTSTTINLPDESSSGVENPPQKAPDESIPPLEVPGPNTTPEHIPEKGKKTHAAYAVLIKG